MGLAGLVQGAMRNYLDNGGCLGACQLPEILFFWLLLD